ncbi:MAG: hypothetical protein ACERKD_22795, partial [Prolixibacteraceae bacterium]
SLLTFWRQGKKVRLSARHQVDGIIANSKLDPIYNRIILPSSIFSKIHPIYELIQEKGDTIVLFSVMRQAENFSIQFYYLLIDYF